MWTLLAHHFQAPKNGDIEDPTQKSGHSSQSLMKDDSLLGLFNFQGNHSQQQSAVLSQPSKLSSIPSLKTNRHSTCQVAPSQKERIVTFSGECILRSKKRRPKRILVEELLKLQGIVKLAILKFGCDWVASIHFPEHIP